MLLAFLHQATLQLKQRAVFAFGTELTDLSSAFELREVDDMLAKTNVLIEDYASGTRLGNALKCLRQQHAHRLVAKRSLVLLISDGLDTGDVQELDRELKWLKDHSKTLLWLNPLLRYDAYEPLAKGAQVVAKHAKASLAIHHLDHLKHLTQGLEKLVRA
jgi:uncharacterized protein with von Willebrand factor type A (vWA) domain